MQSLCHQVKQASKNCQVTIPQAAAANLTAWGEKARLLAVCHSHTQVRDIARSTGGSLAVCRDTLPHGSDTALPFTWALLDDFWRRSGT
jgi:hypothetical protein